MSAIFGIFRFDGGAANARELERMGNTLAIRGPDGRTSAVDGPVGLGHCLMRVNAEDLFEVQPLRSPISGVVLVADCRIDNREALALEFGLDAAASRDLPDSAFVLRAYEKWGADCAAHLLGDFAFAIWDSRARTLLLGRDHMGQRGLFYHHGDGFLVFASDVQALWAVEGVPRRLSDDAIGRGLLMAIDRPPGQSIFETISILPGACVLQVDGDGAAALRSYWQPHAGAAHLGQDEAYYLATYRSVLAEAVACRVRRLLRPPALCFSGGFDSGGIAALAGPILMAQGRKMIAVASVLAEGDKRPAIRDARAAVEAFRDRPYLDIRYYIRGDDGAFSDLETIFDTTHVAAGTPYVRRGLFRIASAAGARLIMDGHGGDYTVNVRAGAMLGRMLLRGRLRGFAREFRLRMRATKRGAHRVLWADVLPALLPLRAIAAIYALHGRLVPEWRRRPVAEGFARSLIERGTLDPSRLRGTYPVHNRWRDRWLHFLRRAAQGPATRATLAATCGLDFTQPFHDKRVVEFGLAIPETLQFKNGQERYLARQALSDLLPSRLLTHVGGNDAEDPDMFRMAVAAAPAALAQARALDRDGRLSRYVDFEKLAAMIENPDEAHRPDHHRLYVANFTLAVARFIAWFERTNR